MNMNLNPTLWETQDLNGKYFFELSKEELRDTQ